MLQRICHCLGYPERRKHRKKRSGSRCMRSVTTNPARKMLRRPTWRAKSQRFKGTTLLNRYENRMSRAPSGAHFQEDFQEQIAKQAMCFTKEFWSQDLSFRVPGLPHCPLRAPEMDWESPAFPPCSPSRGSSLLRSRPSSLPPACTAFQHQGP